MFTQVKVKTVSDHASLLSDGAFGLQAIGSSLGYGVRYIDGRQQIVWLGSRGARQAVSYYLGVIDALNTGLIADLPEEVNAVRAELVRSGWNRKWNDRGHEDASGFLRNRQ